MQKRRFLLILLTLLLLTGLAAAEEPGYAIVLKPNAQLYRLPLAENPMAEVPLGVTVSVVSVMDVGDVSWSLIALEDGTEGFLPTEYLVPLTNAQAEAYRTYLAKQDAPESSVAPAPEPSAAPEPTAQALPELRKLEIFSVSPFNLAFGWDVENLDDELYWCVYQGDEMFDFGLIETAAGSLDVWILPNASYYVEIYHNGTDQVLDFIEFKTPEAERFRSPSISVQYFRLSYGAAGSDNLSSHTGARTITVADTKNPNLDFFVYLTGTYSTSSTFYVDELLVLYRDGNVVAIQDYGQDSFPGSWPGFNMTNPFPAEYLEVPGSYTATIYFNEERVATTTFSVVP